MKVAEALGRVRGQGRAALVGYLPAGFPTVPGGIAAIRAMIEAGVDVVEVGLPYSDPVMDGPVIQRASEAALAGGAGLITPDLIPEEAGEWLAAADAHRLDRVFLVAPSSTDQRIASTVAACRGFVYAAALMGVTGARDQLSQAAPELVARLRATDRRLPVGVGLGVRDGAQAATIAGYADAVIVGSALVNTLLAAPDEPAGREALSRLTADLAAGVRQPGDRRPVSAPA